MRELLLLVGLILAGLLIGEAINCSGQRLVWRVVWLDTKGVEHDDIFGFENAACIDALESEGARIILRSVIEE
jgi:hypothetical protein